VAPPGEGTKSGGEAPEPGASGRKAAWSGVRKSDASLPSCLPLHWALELRRRAICGRWAWAYILGGPELPPGGAGRGASGGGYWFGRG